jgi:hypothetical protein
MQLMAIALFIIERGFARPVGSAHTTHRMRQPATFSAARSRLQPTQGMGLRLKPIPHLTAALRSSRSGCTETTGIGCTAAKNRKTPISKLGLKNKTTC